MEQKQHDIFELQVDPQSQEYLNDTHKWARFLAILGFVTILIIFATGAIQVYELLQVSSTETRYLLLIMFYFLLAVLTFFPSFFLLRFSNRMQAALRNNDQDSLLESFRNLRACYRFLGILGILVIGVWIFSLALSVT